MKDKKQWYVPVTTQYYNPVNGNTSLVWATALDHNLCKVWFSSTGQSHTMSFDALKENIARYKLQPMGMLRLPDKSFSLTVDNGIGWIEMIFENRNKNND